MIPSAVLSSRFPRASHTGHRAAEAYPQTAVSPATVFSAPGGAVRTIYTCEGARSYEQRPYQQRRDCHLRDARHVGQAREGSARTRQGQQGEQVNAAVASPTRTCTSWCLGTHPVTDPCFSGYDTTPLTRHDPLAVITRDGVTQTGDEVRVGVEQAPGQPAHIGVSHGEGSGYELTGAEAIAHGVQLIARGLAALQAEVTS